MPRWSNRKGYVKPKDLAWKPTGEYGGFEHPEYAKISRTAIYKNGNFLFDSFKITEKPGAIIVPWEVDAQNQVRVGMANAERHYPRQVFLEFPRGFGEKGERPIETAYRELFEETELVADGDADIVNLGLNNPNSSFFEHAIPVVAIRFDSIGKKDHPKQIDAIERILNVQAYTKRQAYENMYVAEKQSCGMTSAPIGMFDYYITTNHPKLQF